MSINELNESVSFLKFWSRGGNPQQIIHEREQALCQMIALRDRTYLVSLKQKYAKRQVQSAPQIDTVKPGENLVQTSQRRVQEMMITRRQFEKRAEEKMLYLNKEMQLLKHLQSLLCQSH